MTTQEYFDSHTIDPEFAKKFGWSWDDEKITIPIKNENGEVVFNHYRHLTGDTKFSFDPGAKKMLYASHVIKDNEWVVYCEGEPDCVRLWQEGIPAVTSTSGVESVSEDILEPLRGKDVYICLDNDDAGKKAIEKHYKALESVGARPAIIELPDGVKDVCEYFKKGHKGEDLMVELLTLDQWMDKHEPDEFQLEAISDLLAEDIPEEKWIIERVLPAEGFTFIFGAEGTGKSLYTLSIAKAIIENAPWLGRFQINTKTRILFIDKENSRKISQDRFKGMGIEDNDGMIYRVKYPHYFDLVDPKEEDGISKFAKSLSRKVDILNIGLIVIDSFTDVMIGNENAAGDTQVFFDTLRRLFPNRAFLVLHHENKPSITVRSSAQRARGSTNINAQIVSGFRVAAMPNTINEFSFEQTKARDSQKLPKFKVNLVSQVNPDGKGTYISEVAYGGEVIDIEAKNAEARQVITELLDKNYEFTKEDLYRACESKDISKRTADTVLGNLVKSQDIDYRQDKNNHRKRVYFRPIIEGEDQEL